MVEHAHYEKADVAEEKLRTAFVQGLHPEIRMYLETEGMDDDIEDALKAASKYWQARNKEQTELIIGARWEKEFLPRKTKTPAKTIEEEEVPLTKGDDRIDQLIDQMNKLSIQVADIKKGQTNYPVQKFTAQNNRPEYRRETRTCIKCGEEGHIAWNCMAETKRRAQPSNQNRTIVQRPPAAHVAQFYEDWEVFPEEEEIPGYYAAGDNQRPTRAEGSRRPLKRTRPIQEEPEDEEEAPVQQPTPRSRESSNDPVLEGEIRRLIGTEDEEMAEQEDEATKTDPRKRKPRIQKHYAYNAWADIGARKADITISQLLQIAPAAKSQMQFGIRISKPPTTRIAATAETTEFDTRKTSAYAICHIENASANAIIDTGAGGCIISKPLVDRLGWSIEEPTRMAFTTANGETATPLGKIRDIPIRFGNATIPVDCIVVDTATYDLILGNEWLAKAKATVDLNAEAMRISWKGKRYEIPLNLDRGVKPRIITEEDAEGYYTILEEAPTMLNQEQESQVRQLTMQWQWCPICDKKVYCAELLCQCASEFITNQNFDQLISQWTKKANKLQQNREKQLTDEINEQKEWEEKTAEQDPYLLEFDGKHPNPTRELWQPIYGDSDSSHTLWDIVLQCLSRMGQKQLTQTRKFYWEGNFYWNEIPPQDAWSALKWYGCNPNWIPTKSYKIQSNDTNWCQQTIQGRQTEESVDSVLENLEGFPQLFELPETSDKPVKTYRKEWSQVWNQLQQNKPQEKLPEEIVSLQETLRKIRQQQKEDLTVKRPSQAIELLEPVYAIPSITYRKTSEQAVPPTRKTQLAAGYDITAAETVTIEPGETALVPIGIAFNIPAGYFGITQSRSSLAKVGVVVIQGIIDADYQGPVFVIIHNQNRTQKTIIYQGDRFAQIIFQQHWGAPQLQQDQSMPPPTARGQQGFGSTGANATIVKHVITNVKHSDKRMDKHSYKLGPRLTTEQQQQVKNLLTEFEDTLATDFDEIQNTQPVYNFDIDTGDHPPIRRRPYRINPKYQEWLRKEIAKMEAAGIVQRSNSPWSSPPVIVPKKGSEPGETVPRLCIDYRELNKITVKDANPVPRMHDLIDGMETKPRFFTSLDLFSGYHQFGMTEAARLRSAFSTPMGLYEYTRMPFGLCNAPPKFQQAVEIMFGDLPGVTAYLDDITIYSATFGEHLETLRQVLTKLRECHMFLKPSKCTIATHTIKFLGYIIDQHGMRTDPGKVVEIAKFPRPTNQSEVRAFLGMLQHYRRFIQDCSTIAEPMNRLLMKNAEFKWTIPCEKAFKKLKLKLCTAPVIARPEFGKPFKLYTDASAIGLGAVLTQDDKFGKEHVIAYASRGTRGPEKNYASSELEFLAVHWAIEKLDWYLAASKFIVFTDHQAISGIMKRKEPGRKFARWIAELQAYDFDIRYRPGKTQQHVDLLSRNPKYLEANQTPLARGNQQ